MRPLGQEVPIGNQMVVSAIQLSGRTFHHEVEIQIDNRLMECHPRRNLFLELSSRLPGRGRP